MGNHRKYWGWSTNMMYTNVNKADGVCILWRNKKKPTYIVRTNRNPHKRAAQFHEKNSRKRHTRNARASPMEMSRQNTNKSWADVEREKCATYSCVDVEQTTFQNVDKLIYLSSFFEKENNYELDLQHHITKAVTRHPHQHNIINTGFFLFGCPSFFVSTVIQVMSSNLRLPNYI